MMMLFWFFCPKIQWINRISGIMVSMLTLNAVDCGFEPRLGQTENCKIGIWCFSSKYAALWSNNWLAQNQKILKNKFKQWWSIIPPLYTKWNNHSHLKSGRFGRCNMFYNKTLLPSKYIS
jgi:hypothetical protein